MVACFWLPIPERPVEVEDQDDAIIEVWEVSPHPGREDFDTYVEKDYGEMVKYVGDSLGNLLERFDDDELAEGVTITIRRGTMPRAEYEELTEE